MAASELTSNDSRSTQVENKLAIRNWNKFQHYGNRPLIWVKVYKTLLDDRDWHALPGDSAKILVMLWLIASENQGQLPSLNDLAFRLRISADELKTHITQHLRVWIEFPNGNNDASDLLANRYQDASLEEKIEGRKERKKDNIPEPAFAASGVNGKIYAFENGVVKLLSKDLDRWQKTFTEINVTAELEAASQWLNQQGTNWFHAASGLLGKRNREAKTKKDSLLAPPPKPVRPGRSQWSNF